MPPERRLDRTFSQLSQLSSNRNSRTSRIIFDITDLDWYSSQRNSVLTTASDLADDYENQQAAERNARTSFELADLDWYPIQRISRSSRTNSGSAKIASGSTRTIASSARDRESKNNEKNQILSEENVETRLEIPESGWPLPEVNVVPATPLERKIGHEGQVPDLDTGDEVPGSRDQHDPVALHPLLPQGNASIRTYLRIFSYSSHSDVAFLIVAIITSAGSGFAPPIMNIIIANLVKNFTSYSSPIGISKDEFSRNIEHNTLITVYLFVATFAFSYLSHLCFRVVGIRLSSAIRLAYLKALFSQSVETIDTLPPGQTAKAITARANELQLGISEKLGVFLRSAALMIGSAAVAFRFSWSLALVTSSILVFVVVVQAVVVPLLQKRLKQIEYATSQAASIASEVFNSIRMIVASGAEDRVSSRHHHWVKEARIYERYLSPLVALQLAPLFIAIYSNTALVFWFGIRQYVHGHIHSIGTIVAVLLLVLSVFTSIGQVIAPLDKILRASKAAAEMFAVIDAKRVPDSGLVKVRLTGDEDIQFLDVHFAYPSRPHVKVLKGFSLTLKAGKITAIVGPSGSGKSTVVALIEKWYSLQRQRVNMNFGIDEGGDSVGHLGEPVQSQGHVFVGGTDIEHVETQSWRSQIGLVAQTPFLFNDTIRNNILFGLQGTQWQDSDDATKQRLVEEACEEAFADEFIARLPQGYDTRVGASGIQLSGGQRQRLAIARSIIKKPAILILDEATSAMDVQSERIVQAALDRVSQSRTTIVIAHRLSTVKKADKIVVVKSGQVVEQGTHQELLSLEDGLYSSLVHKQQLAWEDEDFDPNPKRDAMSASSVYDETYSVTSTNLVLVKEKPSPTPPAPPNELPKAAKTFRQLLRNQRGLSLWYLVALLGAGIAGCGLPMQSYILANLVNVFKDPKWKIAHDGNRWALYSFILALVVGVGYGAIGYASSEVSALISQTFRQEYFESILYQRISFWDAEGISAGSMLAQLTNDPIQLQQLMGLNLAIVLSGIFSIIGCIAISFAFGWKLALVNISFTLPLTFFAGFFRLRFERAFEQMYAKVFAESSKFAAESVINFRTVASLTLEDYICRKYNDLLQWHARRAFRKATYSTVFLALSESVALATQALIFWYGGRLLASGEYQLIGFFVNYLACVQGGEAAGQWLSFLPNAALAIAAVKRIFQVRNSRVETADNGSGHFESGESGVQIAFENVNFTYPIRDIPVFGNLNLTIENGKTTALVGASGSGKSSIVSLIERFYDADSGRITWNGKDIANLNLKKYRQAISLVAQESNLIQGTIRQNIMIGVDETTTTDEQLIEACREACIHDFIMSLPNGYSTEIGANGVSLSGGQAQRLSIARALIRNPRLLLLDEATSNLDSESEGLIQQALRRVRDGRTMLIVAHRLATIKDADVIYVLGAGRVLEKGRHDDLIARRGTYWRMCQSQTLQT